MSEYEEKEVEKSTLVVRPGLPLRSVAWLVDRSVGRLVGQFGGLKLEDGWWSLHLRCIVVKATQVLQSRLVAELVLVLWEKQEDGDWNQ